MQVHNYYYNIMYFFVCLKNASGKFAMVQSFDSFSGVKVSWVGIIIFSFDVEWEQ